MRMLISGLVALAVAVGWLLPVPAYAGACYDCGSYCELVCVQGQCTYECYEVCFENLWDGSSGCRMERLGDLLVCFPEGYPCHIFLS